MKKKIGVGFFLEKDKGVGRGRASSSFSSWGFFFSEEGKGVGRGRELATFFFNGLPPFFKKKIIFNKHNFNSLYRKKISYKNFLLSNFF